MTIERLARSEPDTPAHRIVDRDEITVLNIYRAGKQRTARTSRQRTDHRSLRRRRGTHCRLHSQKTPTAAGNRKNMARVQNSSHIRRTSPKDAGTRSAEMNGVNSVRLKDVRHSVIKDPEPALMTSLSVFLTLNVGDVDADIKIVSSVLGLLPARSGLLLVPNPVVRTSLPLASAAPIVANTLSTASFAADFLWPVRAASRSAIFALFTLSPPPPACPVRSPIACTEWRRSTALPMKPRIGGDSDFCNRPASRPTIRPALTSASVPRRCEPREGPHLLLSHQYRQIGRAAPLAMFAGRNVEDYACSLDGGGLQDLQGEVVACPRRAQLRVGPM